MAEHLARRALGSSASPFLDLLAQITDPARGVWSREHRRTLGRTLRALAEGDDAALPSLFDLRELYLALHPTARLLRDSPPRRVSDAYSRCDPLAARLDLAEQLLERIDPVLGGQHMVALA